MQAPIQLPKRKPISNVNNISAKEPL